MHISTSFVSNHKRCNMVMSAEKEKPNNELLMPREHKIPIPNHIRPPYEEGFPVLRLPKKGEDLMEGRQYELSPTARAYIDETWGLVLPRVVECLFKKRPGTRIATLTTNLETGESKWNVMIDPPRASTFRAWMTNGKIHKFTLDCAWLAEREHEMNGSHKARDYAEKDLADLPKSTLEKLARKPREKKEAVPAFNADNILNLLKL